jgi:hypothetical protein
MNVRSAAVISLVLMLSSMTACDMGWLTGGETLEGGDTVSAPVPPANGEAERPRMTNEE